MNWKQEAIERLERYPAMQQARRTIPLELERLAEEAKALRSGLVTCVAGKKTGDQDSRLINNMIRRQELTWSLQDAEHWIRVTNMALNNLPQQERQILEGMYYGNRKKVSELERQLGMERSTVYRHRDKALERFALALYGAVDS